MPGCAKKLTNCLASAALAAGLALSAPPVPAFAQAAAPAAERKQASVEELDALLEAASVSDQRARELAAEISALKKDETSVTAALIQSAKTERKLSQEISPIEDRLMEYRTQEDAIRQSLFARREVLSEVLAALQRMGLNPPPAILVTPQDALSSVRSAILLGAVVPQLRGETEILLADMESLSKVMVSIKAERERLLAALKNQAEEKIRLDQLVEEKKSLRTSSEAALKEERARIADLAKQSKIAEGTDRRHRKRSEGNRQARGAGAQGRGKRGRRAARSRSSRLRRRRRALRRMLLSRRSKARSPRRFPAKSPSPLAARTAMAGYRRATRWRQSPADA